MRRGLAGIMDDIAAGWAVPATLAPAATTQQIGTCNSGYYWVDPFCWSRSRDAWGQLAALPPIPASVVAPIGTPANALTDPNSVVYDPTLSQQLSNEQVLQTQANVQGFIDSVPDNPIPDVPCTWLNIPCGWLMVGAGVAVFALVALGSGSPRRYGR